ncbi:MAG: GGDEF domain-containing protein [Butyrivibrio sp.]|uniref:GGDEF domain-containing protein n=1 Tax=Butyrivibrio sp. TaxID=28121 RepID=UPI0025BA424A|nr:GGDEF domain-containing protein [Butyrivibrio sp.]MBQ6588266.1 GGDEF domain-containing protein [Butyrivibrio sp.]
MINKALEDYTAEDLLILLNENVDAIVMVDTTDKKYRAITRKNIFVDLLDETGDYDDLIQKLWFHLDNSQEEITEDYKAFIAYYGEFKGKYSRRLKVFLEGNTAPYVIQMNVYPIEGTDKYVFAMDVLDDEEVVEDIMTTRKVNTIQNTYLFSMFVDLVKDSTSSISVTEISEDTIKSSIKYSQWRLMTVNMIWPDDQEQFLKLTDPEYLRANLDQGHTNTFDCMMKNLEGTYIWVKLIFSRVQTLSDKDFKFVFMVQDINDDVMERMATLKKYEELVLVDPLTGLFNHGGIKTEIQNAINIYQNGGDTISLMMIDLDNFKKINDNYGHSVGDATLKALADMLKSFAQDKHASVGRWGGEEFVTVLSGVSDDEALEYAEDLRKTVAAADFGEAGHITCSVGISQLGDDDSFDDLFNRMDKAMYSSKTAGRNRVTVL